ncbi:hypothetical protein AK88_00544 [Plasmodium fragile]|uniref:Uncharacterized protein n=1 Tax=Plasmodium fragile TaxID=5857 RepID=A0A0D9QSC5_PLAFR|nr:uncharacterized protein AK88_00544 [Plasmodium fragile]KJP89833.1 hypothetical protein AK88_00544 [Plasmodium fragile]
MKGLAYAEAAHGGSRKCCIAGSLMDMQNVQAVHHQGNGKNTDLHNNILKFEMKNKMEEKLSSGKNRCPLRTPAKNACNENSYLREEDKFLYSKSKDLTYYSVNPKPLNSSPSSSELSMNRTELKKKSDDLVVTHILQNEENDVMCDNGMSPEVGTKVRKNDTSNEKSMTGMGREPVFGRHDSLEMIFREGHIPPRSNHYEGDNHPPLICKMDGTSYDKDKRMALPTQYEMRDPLHPLHQSGEDKIPNEGTSIFPSRLIKTEWTANHVGGRENSHKKEATPDADMSAIAEGRNGFVKITKEVHGSNNYSFIDQRGTPKRNHMNEMERKQNGTQDSSGSSTTRHRGHLPDLPHFGTIQDEGENAEDADYCNTASVMGSNDPKKSTQLRSRVNEGQLKRANDSTNQDDSPNEMHKFNNTEQSLSDLIRAFQLKRAQNMGAPSSSDLPGVDNPKNNYAENRSAAPKKEMATRLYNCTNANNVKVAEKWVKRYEAPPQGNEQKIEELGDVKKGATLKMSYNRQMLNPSKWVLKDPFNKPKRSRSDDKTFLLSNNSGFTDSMHTYGYAHHGENKLEHVENMGEDPMDYYYLPRDTNIIELDAEGGNNYHLLNHQNCESTNDSSSVHEGMPYEKLQYIPANYMIINGEEYHPSVENVKNEQMINSQENLTYPLMSDFMQPLVGSRKGLEKDDSNYGSFVERKSCKDGDFVHQKDKLSKSINYIRQIKKANEQARYAISMEDKVKRTRQAEECARVEENGYFVSPRFGSLSQEEVEEVREASSCGEKKNRRVNPVISSKRDLREEGILKNARKHGNSKNGKNGYANWALKNDRGEFHQKMSKDMETPPKDRRVELVQNVDLAEDHLSGEKIGTPNRPNHSNRPNRLHHSNVSNVSNLSDSLKLIELKRKGEICKSGANVRASAKKEDFPMKQDHKKDEKYTKRQTNTTLRRCPKIGSKKNDTNKALKIKSPFISKHNNIPMHAVQIRNEPLKSIKMVREERQHRHHNESQQYGNLNRTGKIICERKKMKSKDKYILFQKGASKKEIDQDTPVEQSDKGDINKIYTIPSCHSSSSYDNSPIRSLNNSNLSCDSQETKQVSTLANMRKNNLSKMKEMISREREAVRRGAIVAYPHNGARGGKNSKWEVKGVGKKDAKGEPKRNALCRTKNVAPIETSIYGKHEIGKGTKGIMGGRLGNDSVETQIVESHKAEDYNISARKAILAKKNKSEKYPLDIEVSYKCKSIYIKINVDSNNEELLKHTQHKFPKRSLEFKLFTTKFVNGFIKSTESKIYKSSSIILQNAETDVFYNITIHVYSTVVSSLWLYGSASFYLTKYNVDRFKLKTPSSVTFNKEGGVRNGMLSAERSAPKRVASSSSLAREKKGESKGASKNTPEKGKHGEPLFFTNSEGQNTQDCLLEEEVKDISLDEHSSSSFDDDISSDESDVRMENVNSGINLKGSHNVAHQHNSGHSDHNDDGQGISNKADSNQRNDSVRKEGGVSSSTYDELLVNLNHVNKIKIKKNEAQNVHCDKGEPGTSAVEEKNTSNGEEENNLQHNHRGSSRGQHDPSELPIVETDSASYITEVVQEEDHRVQKSLQSENYLDENKEGNLKYTKFLMETGGHNIMPDSTKLLSNSSLGKEDTTPCSFIPSSTRSFKDTHESSSGSVESHKGKQSPAGGPPLMKDKNNFKINFFRNCESGSATNILDKNKKSSNVEEGLPMLGAQKEKLAQIGRLLSEKWTEDKNENCMTIVQEVEGIPKENNAHMTKSLNLGGLTLTRANVPPNGKETKGDNSRRHLHNSFVHIPSMEKWKKENGLRNDSHLSNEDPQLAEKEPNSTPNLVFSRGTFVYKNENEDAEGLEATQGRDEQNEVNLLSEIRNAKKSNDEGFPHSSDLTVSGDVQVKAKECASGSNEHGPVSRDTPSHDKGEKLSKGNFPADKVPTFRDEVGKWNPLNRSDAKHTADSNCNKWILHKNGNVANKASAPNGLSTQNSISDGKSVHKFGPWMNRGYYPPQGKYTLPVASPYKMHQGRSVGMYNPVCSPMCNPVSNPMCSAMPDKSTKLQSKNIPVQLRTRAEEGKMKYAQLPYFNKTNRMVNLPNGAYLLQGNNTVGHKVGRDFANKFSHIGEKRAPSGLRSGIPSVLPSGTTNGLEKKMHNSEDLLYKSNNYKNVRCAQGAVEVPPIYNTCKSVIRQDGYVDLPHFAQRQNYNGANCPILPTQMATSQNAETHAKESAPKIPPYEESITKDTPHGGINLRLRKSNPEEDGLPTVGAFPHNLEPKTGANNCPSSGGNVPRKDLTQAEDNNSYKKGPTQTFQKYLNGEITDCVQGGVLPGQGGPSSGQQHINLVSGAHTSTNKLAASMQGNTDMYLRQKGSPNNGPSLFNPLVGDNMPKVYNNIKMFAFNEEGITAHLENQKRNKNQGKTPLYPYMQHNMHTYGTRMQNNLDHFKNGYYLPSCSPPDDVQMRAACLNEHAMHNNQNVLKKGNEHYFGRPMPNPVMSTYAPLGDNPYAAQNGNLEKGQLRKCRFLHTPGLPNVTTENQCSFFKTNQEKLSDAVRANASGNINPVEFAAQHVDQNVQRKVGAYAPWGDARRVVIPGRAGQFPSPYVHWPQCAPQNALHMLPPNANPNRSPINMHRHRENPRGMSPSDGRSSPCSGYRPQGASLIKQNALTEKQKVQPGYSLTSLAKQPNQQGATLTSSLVSPNKVKGNTHRAVTFLDEPLILKNDTHQDGSHPNSPFQQGTHPNEFPLQSASHMTGKHNQTSDEKISLSAKGHVPHQPNKCVEWEKSEEARKFDLKYNEINFKSIQCIEQTKNQFADHIYNMAKGCNTACSEREYTYTDNTCVKSENSFGKNRKFSPFFGLRNSGNYSNTEDHTECTEKTSPTATTKSFQLSIQLGEREWGKIKFTCDDILDDKINKFIESNNLKKIFLSPLREKLKYMLKNDVPKWSMSITEML